MGASDEAGTAMTKFVLGRLRARSLIEEIKSTILLCCSKLQAALPRLPSLTEIRGRGFVRVTQVNCAEQAACSLLSPIKH